MASTAARLHPAPAPPPPGWRPSPSARKAALAVLAHGHLSDPEGAESARLEAAVAALSGLMPDAVRALASGSGALYAALLAAGVPPRARVLLSALAPPYVAGVLTLVGARPVAVDVEPDTLTLDDSAVRAAYSARPAQAVVWTAGLQSDAALSGACTPAPVLEDGAALMGARDRRSCAVGARATAGVFSLAYGKGLGAGEGGLLTLPDATARARLRERSAGLRTGGRLGRLPQLAALGRLPLLTTAIALAALPELEVRREARRHVATRLAQAAGAAGVQSFPTGGQPLWAGRFATAQAARLAEARAERVRLELAPPPFWTAPSRALSVARDSAQRVRILPWWDAAAARPAEIETLVRAFAYAVGAER